MSKSNSIENLFKRFWWVLLILLLLIGGAVYVLTCGLPWAKPVEEVEAEPADPWDIDTTKPLEYNLDIIKRYLAEDEWSLDRFTIYKNYLDPLAGQLTDEQRPIYDQLIANYNFRYRLNNGQWNAPEGQSLIDLQYDPNLYERTELLTSMTDYGCEQRFADFYTNIAEQLPPMPFSAISQLWHEGDSAVVEPEPVVTTPREPKEPEEKPIIETPSQKLLKALRNYSPQCPEATIREQVELKRYPEYADVLGKLSRKVQSERNTTANHRAAHYEECLKGAEDFEDLCIRYGLE